jgi:hypothetical protein
MIPKYLIDAAEDIDKGPNGVRVDFLPRLTSPRRPCTRVRQANRSSLL